jgi:hypothetical protein
VEEEYNDDGVLSCTPPLFDEVWLSEPERRERREALDKQRTRALPQRDLDIKQRLERAREAPQDLVESDADSDGDSLSSEPVIKSGGDDRDFLE